MARFKDYTGREWNLRLTLGLLPDLKAAGCDLSEAVKSGDWLGDILFGDMERFAGILWAFLKDEAKAAGINRDAFDKLVDPDFAEAASLAIQEEIINFFHRGQKQHLKAQLPKVLAQLNQRMGELANQAGDRAIAEMNAKADSILSESATS